MIYRNLKGLFTAAGFVDKGGRRPTFDDAGWIVGPIDIRVADGKKFQKIIEFGRALPNHSQEIECDASGLIAVPGFCDSHTHALFVGSRANEYLQRWQGVSYREISDAGGGIHNTVRDMKGASAAVLESTLFESLRRVRRQGTATIEIKSGYGLEPQEELRHLRILKRVRALATQSTEYPEVVVNFLGLHALPKAKTESDFVDEMISILPTIRSEGLADFIDAFPEQGFFSLSESVRFIQAGQKQGLAAKVHADEMSDLNSAATFAQMGALSVDHLQKISADGIAALSKTSTVATMLPATSFYVGLEYAPARKLWDAGAAVALATDWNPGTAPSDDLFFTMMLASSQMKMTAAEIFCAVTYNAARACGLKDRGTIASGMSGNLNFLKLESQSRADMLAELVLEGQKKLRDLTPHR